jgi:VirB8 protein
MIAWAIVVISFFILAVQHFIALIEFTLTTLAGFILVLAATDRWTDIPTIVVEPPRDAERLRKNPLGVFIHAINWRRSSADASQNFVRDSPRLRLALGLCDVEAAA